MPEPVAPATDTGAAPPAAADTGAAPPEAQPQATILDGGAAPAADPKAEGQDPTQKQTPETPEKDPEKQTDKDAKGKEGAPETYETFKVPEGFTLDQATLETFTPLAKELNLNQEQAQKLVDFEVSRMTQFQTAQAQAFANQVAAWGEETRGDKEVGGPAFDASVQAAGLAMNRFGTPELRAIFALPSKENPKGLGLGNHPELIRFIARVGKAMGEDTFHSSSLGSGKEEKSLGKKFYPDMNP